MESLAKKDLEAMLVSMRRAGLAHNSISSYCRVLRTFLNWCHAEGFNAPPLPNIKDKETLKEAYTDEELEALLKRPKKNASFCEFRNWVIVCFLMNSGCRAASVRNIQNQDVALENRQSLLRYNKNGKIQVIHRLRANKNAETKTLGKLCAIPDCKPEDIAQYMKEDPRNPNHPFRSIGVNK